MDKYERVAEEVAVELVGTPVYPQELLLVADILRREYGDDEYIHKEIARVATLEALEEAARVCDMLSKVAPLLGEAEQLQHAAAMIRSRKDHIGDATVMLPRDVAESLRDYLAHKQTASGMETHRAEADGMDDEYAALCEALGEGT